MNKENYLVIVYKGFDPNNPEKEMTEENIELLAVNPKNLIVATSDGSKNKNGLIEINAISTGESYDTISRMFMLLASNIQRHFVEKSNEEE